MKPKRYIEAKDLPEGDKLYLRRGAFGWRIVHPIKIDGKINKWNLMFGGKENFVFLVILLLIASVSYVGITELIDNYQEIAENPCDFCRNCDSKTIFVYPNEKYNFSDILVDGDDISGG